MARHSTLASLFGDIAAAIRAKTGNEDLIVADNFDTAIAEIETRGTYQTKTVTPSASEVQVNPDTGYDALQQVNVNAVPYTEAVTSGTTGYTATIL